MEQNKVIKAGIWYTICNFFVKGLAFITMPIFTRILSSNDIGIFSNITSWFNILAIITTFELYSSVNIARFDYKNNLKSYISSTLFLGSIITCIFYIIILIFKDYFLDLFMMDFMTLNIIFVYLLVYPALQMFQIKNQISYNYKPTIIISIINALSTTIISIVLILLLKNKLYGRIFGYFLPLIITTIPIYIYLMLDGKCISKKYWKYAIKISLPLILHLLAGYLLSSSDKIMISKINSPSSNALYSVAYTISSVVSILWMSMNNAWSPWAYEMMDRKDYEKLKQNSKPYLLFFISIVFFVMLISPELLLIIGGKNYIESKYTIPPVMVGLVFQFVYSLYVNIEFYYKKQSNIAIGTIIAALINIILNAIFLPKYGYIAAAYTTLIGYIILFIIHFLFVKKLKCTYWYDTHFFLKILLMTLISIPIINLLYINNIIRYSLILLFILTILILIIKNKSEILQSLKNRNFKSLTKLIIKGKKEV